MILLVRQWLIRQLAEWIQMVLHFFVPVNPNRVFLQDFGIGTEKVSLALCG